MNKLCVVIPVYKDSLTQNEIDNIFTYANYFNPETLYFLGPKNLDYTVYKNVFPAIQFIKLRDKYFKNTKTYNKLMIDVNFYKLFENYEYLLIAQTDACIINPAIQISKFIDCGWDYIGAPWFSSPFKKGRLPYIKQLLLKNDFSGVVGNGGFSLRKVSSIIKLLEKWPQFLIKLWPFNEDIFFSYLGLLDKLQMPPINIAAEFCLEENMEEFIKIGQRPMAIHAWEKMGLDKRLLEKNENV